MESYLNNKYYVPEITEFHIGFEYERMDGGNYCKNICEPYDISSLQTMLNKQVLVAIQDDSDSQKEYGIKALDDKTYNNYKKCVKLDRIRVKYLDEQDIIELGFEPITDHKKWGYLYGAQFRKAYTKDKSITIKLQENNNITIAVVDHYDYEDYNKMVFTIKNKSELKRILKMLEL